MSEQITFSTSIILGVFAVVIVNAQAPSIEWQKSYGGTSSDFGTSIIQTKDGGYALAGATDGDTSANNSGTDFWIAKLKEDGSVMWQKSLGGSYEESVYSMSLTFDQGFIVAGNTASNDGDVSGNHGNMDIWIVKLDSIGNIQWQKCLGSIHSDYVGSVIQTTDSGFVVVGEAEDNSGDVTNNHGGWDYWFAKLNKEGTLQWENSYGGSKDEKATSVIQTPDSGFVIAGSSGSNDGDVSVNKGYLDCWLVKINSVGIIQWEKSFGGSSGDGAMSVKMNPDGGFAVAGSTGSNDYDVAGNHGIGDVWLIKLDHSGNLLWQKCYGGSDDDFPMAMDFAPNDGYVIAGATISIDGDVTGYHVGYPGYHDYWVLRIDSIGNLLWEKCLGGTADDIAYSVATTNDNGYVTTGYSYSTDGDVTDNIGGDDGWVVKLSDETGILETQERQSSFLFPNPSTTFIRVFSDRPKSSLLIYDLAARILETETITTSGQSIDITSLPAGIYFAELINPDHKLIEKFVKQ